MAISWSKNKKAKVVKCVKYWASFLLLDSWDLRIEFENNEALDWAANVTIDHTYSRAVVTVNSTALKPPNSLDEVVAHEMIHVLLSGITNNSIQLLSGNLVTSRELIDSEERTVEHLTRILTRGL